LGIGIIIKNVKQMWISQNRTAKVLQIEMKITEDYLRLTNKKSKHGKCNSECRNTYNKLLTHDFVRCLVLFKCSFSLILPDNVHHANLVTINGNCFAELLQPAFTMAA
jgi:hypothetical protein